jgi:quercetin dioxygenase-like cupin family protein
LPFHRFEDFKSYRFNPHLSTAEGPVIEGETLYFRMVTKRAGTGAELHYHPNELMAFPLQGKVDCIVGKDRRIVRPGTFVHFPPYARHGFKATEDGDLKYLYIKDRTWTLIGAAADEALPEKALSATQVQRAVKAGKYPGGEKGAREVAGDHRGPGQPLLPDDRIPRRAARLGALRALGRGHAHRVRLRRIAAGPCLGGEAQLA